MLSERIRSSDVTVRLIDGQIRRGRLNRFTPSSADLTLEIAHAKAGAPPLRNRVPSETIASVAFRREGPPSSRRKPSHPHAAAVRVHLVGGAQVLVDAPAGEMGHPLGFYATPASEDDPHDEYFFYRHGLSVTESVTPLGEILVKQGSIRPAELDRGLAAQRAGAHVPLGQILVEQEKVAPEAIETAVATHTGRRLRIGELLVESGLATKEDIEHALAEQKKRAGRRLGEVLVELGIVREDAIARALSQKFHIPFVDLDATPIDPAAANSVPADLLEKHGVLPIASEGPTLVVAISDPLALEAVDALRFRSKRRVREVVATPSALRRNIAALLESRTRNRIGAEVEGLLHELGEAKPDSVEEEQIIESDSAIIRVVNQILLDAYLRGASDIHIEPNGRNRATMVRFRIDGDCLVYQELPAAFRAAIVSRLKIMAHLDISERRRPQDGKIRFKMRDRDLEFRVATIPTVDENEDVVLRLLAGGKPLALDDLSLTDRNLRELRTAIRKPYGLFLCVGPTGSGKTTTLHSVLGELNGADMKIWTAEDPVEITQPGLRQVQVHPKIGFNFAAALRAFLRADPDVIMVGEMRDQETATIGIEASLTGHLVLSTLHTNSAPETVVRLTDMGLDPFSFADALVGVLAQRLARSLCKSCREPRSLTHAEREMVQRAFDGAAPDEVLDKTFAAKGCDACGGTGFRGRVGLHELLIADDPLKREIEKRSPVGVLRGAARRQGMTTLLEDGILKAARGVTDLRQVLSTCDR